MVNEHTDMTERPPQNGGPSEDTQPLRFNSLDWVPPFCRTPDNHRDYQDWRFAFVQSAKLYLTIRQYRSDENLNQGWILALLKSATLLGEDAAAAKELKLLVQRMVSDPFNKFRGENMLKGIDERWAKDEEREQEKAIENFLTFQRSSSQDLQKNLRQLRDLLTEARRFHYEPDKLTLITRFKSLLTDEEKTLHGLLVKADESSEDRFEKCINAIEDLARDKSSKKSVSANANAAQMKPGGGNNLKKTSQSRNKRNPKRSGFLNDSNDKTDIIKKCGRCGFATCKSLKNDKKKEDCPATKSECNVCGKTGHFASVCWHAKNKNAKANSSSTKQDSDSSF